ncbi:MAG: ABC transporter permease [Xanthomonadales bacterium PRO7]|jgi:sodium transport system permease protein|nr:ABC transporter permease [Xanthomonadales bacterium PRO7]HMM56493.1 ABC transporter permease [Rudaea sp.]
MNSAITVFFKEVRENIRDRRTVINTLFVGPLMAPLIFVLLINTLVTRELSKAEKPLPLPVVGAQYAPNLIAALKQNNVDIKPAPEDPDAAVRNQDADVVLRIGPDFVKAWDKGEPAQVEMIYDASQQDARGPTERLKKLIEGYGQRTGALRLLARGLSPSILKPVVIADRDQSTPQSRAGLMFAMLPYFFILGGFIGGMALAIDTTAGERERQSLEPLLANPVPRWKILGGKLMATTAFAITTVALSIIAFAVVGQFLPTEKIGMSLTLGPRFIVATVFVMLPLAALLGALQTLVAAFAKSYREAQTYLSLLMLVPIIPTLLLSILPIKTQLWMYAVPLLGQQVTIMRLMRGDPVSDMALLICFVCTSIAALVVCAVTARIYYSERLAISA